MNPGPVSSRWSRRNTPAATVAPPASMTSHGPADRGQTRRSPAPSPIEHPPSTMNAAIISCGSRASSAASPLSCTSAMGAAWRSELASHPAVNSTGPAIPARPAAVASFMLSF